MSTAAHGQAAHASYTQGSIAITSSDSPNSIAVDGSGNLYYVSAGLVYKQTLANGTYTRSAISSTDFTASFLVVDTAGNLLVSGVQRPSGYTTLMKLTLVNGGYTSATLETQSPQVFTIQALATDTLGNFYVAEHSRNIIRIEEYAAGSSTVASLINLNSEVSNLAVDPSGNLFSSSVGQDSSIGVYPRTNGTYSASNYSVPITFPCASLGCSIVSLVSDGAGNIYAAYQASEGTNGGVNRALRKADGTYSTGVVVAGLASANVPGSVAVGNTGTIFTVSSRSASVLTLQPPAAVSVGSNGIGGGIGGTIYVPFTLDTAITYAGTSDATAGGSADVSFNGANCNGVDCAVGTQYAAGTTVSARVAFSPTAAGTRYAAVNLNSSTGVAATAFLKGTGTGARFTFLPARSAFPTASALTSPTGVAVDAAGSVYINDPNSGRVLKETPNGTGSTEIAVATSVSGLRGLAVDSSANVYFFRAVGSTYQLERWTTTDGGTTYASTGTVLATGLANPQGVAVDASGNVFIADASANTITELYNLAGAYLQRTVLSGLSSPTSLAIDGSGNLYYGSTSANEVRESELINGVYGSPFYLEQGLGYPQAVAVDAVGYVYIADLTNNRVVRLSPGGGNVTTLSSGFSPASLAVSSNGDVFVSETAAVKVEKITSSAPPALTFAATAVNSTSTDSPQTITFANTGNGAFTPATNDPAYTISAGFAVAASSTCPSAFTSPNSLAAGASCNYLVSFTPAQTGPISGSLVTSSITRKYNINVTDALSGTGVATANLSVPAVSVTYGTQSTTLRANIAYNGAAPTGAVNFTLTVGTTTSSAVGTCTASSGQRSCTASFDSGSYAVGSYRVSVSEAADSNYAASSGTGTLTVAQAAPTASVPAVSAAYGTSPITLTANVSYTGATAPTGTANFVVNQTSVPATCMGTTSPLTCTGSYPATGLAAGTYPIQFTQAADANYSAASASGTLTVGTAALTVSVTSTSVTYGTASTTLTASVAYRGSAAPTGGVGFSVNGGAIVAGTCTGTTSPRSCSVAYNPSALVPNQYTITATQGADTNYAAASGSGTLTVTTSKPVATVNSSTAAYGSASVALSAAFTFAGPVAPSGQVTFTVGNTPPVTATCTGTTSPRTCTANYNASALPANSYPIQVNQAADTNYAAVDASGTLTVSTTAPSISVTSASAVYGANAVMLNASVTYTGSTQPTGLVSFTVNNGAPVTATCSGTASPRNCSASFNPSALPAGSYTLSATEAADGNYSATSASGTLTVSSGTPVVTVSPSSAAFGSTAVQLSASVAYTGSSAPTGAVTFTVNQTTLVQATCSGTASPRTCTGTYNPASLGAGQYPVQATQAADANYAAATSANGTLTVSSAKATINANPASLTYGAATTQLSASVSYSGSTAPTGQVTLSVDGGTPVAATCSAAGSVLFCSASYNTASLTVGSHSLVASQAADTNYTLITSPAATVTVNQAAPAISASNASSTYGSATATLNATVTYTTANPPTGAVSFQINGFASVAATCINGASTLNCSASYNTASLAGGTYSFTATLAADANNAGTSAQANLTVSMASQTLTVASPTYVYGAAPVQLTAQLAFAGSAPPTGAVTFLVDQSSPVLATCTGSVSPQTCVATYNGTPLAGGSHTLTASQTGNANYTSATSNTATIAITPATPTLAVGSPTIAYGTTPLTLTTTLAYTGSAAPTGAISFVIDGTTSVPAACAGTASPRTCSAAYSSLLTVGSHTLVSTITADTNYSATSSPAGTITVNGATPAVSVVSVVAVYGTISVPLTATIAYGQAAPPTGTVSFLIDGTTSVPAICSNSNATRTCTASYNLAGLAVGSHTLSASEAADGNYLRSASGNGTLILNKGTLVVTAQPVSVSSGSASASLVATVAYAGSAVPLGGLTFTLAGSAALPGTCTGNASPLTCTASLSLQNIPAGTYNYTATQAADANYAAASDTKALTVAAQSAASFPVCTLGAIKSASSTSNAISVTASCTDPGGLVLNTTINWGDGTATVAASSSGTNTHDYGTPTTQVMNTILLSATNSAGNTGTATQTVTVVPALAVTAGTTSTGVTTSTAAQPANVAPVQVTFLCTSISGKFSGTTVTNALPSAYGITCTSATLSSATPSAVKVTINTTSSAGTVAMWKRSDAEPVLAGLMLPFCGIGLLAMGGGANRRKRIASLTVLLLLLSFGVYGCGGSFKSPNVVTPVGTYYITVTEVPVSGTIPTGFVQTSLIVPLVVNN